MSKQETFTFEQNALNFISVISSSLAIKTPNDRCEREKKMSIILSLTKTAVIFQKTLNQVTIELSNLTQA